MAMVALAGCQPDPLPVDPIPQLKPRIVVSSQLVPGQTVAILLTKSFGALDANGDSDPVSLINKIAINDASVIIENSVGEYTLTFIGNGVYGGVSIPLVYDEVYTLNVESPTMGKVTASTYVKPPVQFATLGGKFEDTGFDSLAQVHFSFQDLAGKNYYLLNAQHVTAEEPPEPTEFLNPKLSIHLFEDDPAVDGQLVVDSIKVIFRRDSYPGDSLLVQLSNISQDYYKFLKLRKENRFNFSDFVGEPINYPTNVQGGLGWFTLHIPDVRVITIDP